MIRFAFLLFLLVPSVGAAQAPTQAPANYAGLPTPVNEWQWVVFAFLAAGLLAFKIWVGRPKAKDSDREEHQELLRRMDKLEDRLSRELSEVHTRVDGLYTIVPGRRE